MYVTQVISPNESADAEGEIESVETESSNREVVPEAAVPQSPPTSIPLSPNHDESPDFVIRRPVLARSSLSKVSLSRGGTEPNTPSTSSSTSSGGNTAAGLRSLTSTSKQARIARPKLKKSVGAGPAVVSGPVHVFPMELPPFESPSHGLSQGLQKLDSTEW